MRNLVFLIVFGTLFCGCRKENFFRGEFRYAGMADTLRLKGEKLPVDEPGIYAFSVADTFLVVATPLSPDKLVSLYSTNDFSHCGDFIATGNGPDEYAYVNLTRQVEKDTSGVKLWIAGSSRQELFLWNITESVREKRTVVDKRISTGDTREMVLRDPFLLSDTSFFGQNVADRNQAVWYDFKEKTVINEVPLYDGEETEPILFFGIGVPSPDLTKWAQAMISFDQINVLSLQKGGDSFSVSTRKEPIEVTEVLGQTEGREIAYYRDICTTNELIFASWSGCGRMDESGRSTVIHVLDWEGNLKKVLRMPDFMPYFAVDELHECLYAVNSKEELFRFNIREVLN